MPSIYGYQKRTQAYLDLLIDLKLVASDNGQYYLTDEAKKHQILDLAYLCFGEMIVTDIIEYTPLVTNPPSYAGSPAMISTNVKYKYKLKNLPSWTKNWLNNEKIHKMLEANGIYSWTINDGIVRFDKFKNINDELIGVQKLYLIEDGWTSNPNPTNKFK